MALLGGLSIPVRSLETPCTENWAGALHSDAARRILPVGPEMKAVIPV
jgi:hypothetical protein